MGYRKWGVGASKVLLTSGSTCSYQLILCHGLARCVYECLKVGDAMRDYGPIHLMLQYLAGYVQKSIKGGGKGYCAWTTDRKKKSCYHTV
jgi:hypothetical protein